MGKKSKKKQVFNPPVRKPINPYGKGVTYEMIRKQYDAEMTEASNQAFNLAMSAALIASKDMGFSNEMVQELSQRAFGILDDVANDLATIDSMLHLVESWGIEIYHTAQQHTNKQGEKLRKKTSVFQILESGIDEIEDILNVAKKHGIQIDYRDACTWRWEFNSIKYWRDCEMALTVASKCIHAMKEGKSKEEIMREYDITESSFNTYKSSYNQMFTEDGNVTPKMQECWDGFKEGMTVPQVISATGYGKNFVFNAYNEWLLFQDIQDKKAGKIEKVRDSDTLKEATRKAANVKATEVLSTKEFTDKFFEDMEQAKEKENGQDGAKEEAKGANKTSETREENARDSETEKQVSEEESSAKVRENEDGARVEATLLEDETDKEIFGGDSMEEVKEVKAGSKLKKVVKVVEIQGEFTTYKPVGTNSFDIELDGQVITLSREQMKDFGEELLAVAEEEI